MRQPKQEQFSPKISLRKLSAKSFNLQTLIKQAASRKSLEDVFNDSLPEPFQNKFQINSFEQGLLILTCQSAALMTKFRFFQNQILESLNKKVQDISSIKIKIRPVSSTNRTNKKLSLPNSQQHLSKKNAQILIEEAEHTNDVKLKEILIQLAKHGD